uniref:Uncharacterized protein n=1 Tax=Calidris pygmaea TaxID=425635 RepID=A0A8C3K319_9CHAR
MHQLYMIYLLMSLVTRPKFWQELEPVPYPNPDILILLLYPRLTNSRNLSSVVSASPTLAVCLTLSRLSRASSPCALALSLSEPP